VGVGINARPADYKSAIQQITNLRYDRPAPRNTAPIRNPRSAAQIKNLRYDRRATRSGRWSDFSWEPARHYWVLV
jgi:hypothetical protein